MAELPRYQSPGVLFADIPRIDFANVREEARAAQGMSQALDRVSEFAFKQAVQKAEREGLQWGYDNPVTPQQIAAALESGQPLQLPESKTAFGDAAREAQAKSLRGELEAQANQEFVRLSQAVDTGAINDIGRVQTELSAQANGFAKVLAQVSPEEAARFRASIATTGNAVYRSAAKAIQDRNAELKKAEIAPRTEDAKGLISTSIRTVFDPVELRSRIDIITNPLIKDAIDFVGPEFANTLRKDLDKFVSGAVVDSVSIYASSASFAPNDVETLIRLDKGELGNYSAIWATLTDEDRLKIRKQVQSTQSDRYSAEQRVKAKAKDEREAQFVSGYARFVDPATPQAEKNRLRKELVPLVSSRADADSLFEDTKKDGEGDFLLFLKLQDSVSNGEVTSYTQLLPYLGRGLTKSQVSSLATMIRSEDRSAESDARRTLKRYSGVPDVMNGVFDPKDAAFQKHAKLDTRYQDAIKQARLEQSTLPLEKRTGIDYSGIAQSVIQQYEQADKADATKASARKSLLGFEKIASGKNKAVTLDERTSISDLERLKVFSPAELNSIRKNLEIIKRP
jgi:hypothetical protein